MLASMDFRDLGEQRRMRRPSVEADELEDEVASLTGSFNLSGARLAGEQSGIRGEGSISRSILAGCELSGATLGPLSCSDVRFEVVDLSNSSWIKTVIRRAEFSGCKAVGWSAQFERIEDVAFINCRMDFCSWEIEKVSGLVLFEGCTFRDAEFMGRMDGFVFRDCKLDKMRFDAASAEGSDLRNAELRGVSGLTTMRGARISLEQTGEAGVILAEEIGISVE
ncbi:pentapeptide repeat-containing protein [Frankia sp. R43]|uniref:pentapeptide repeat-containing protein n=1 Tax=Frankia sp. R43 TaxID=269536 RepID=UPI00137A9702|nr:pentapeptide repeat-containing protein [Frankia sp. R43]